MFMIMWYLLKIFFSLEASDPLSFSNTSFATDGGDHPKHKCKSITKIFLSNVLTYTTPYTRYIKKISFLTI